MAIQIDIHEQQPSSSEKGSSRFAARLSGLSKKPDATDRMFFTEQLSLLLETGESLYGALTTIVKQTENPTMREVVECVARDVSEGDSFAGALATHEQIFPSTYVNLISASEAGGFMPEVLQQLLDMDIKRDKLRTELISAATYPLFLISFSLAVVIFVLVVVFPKFSAMFTSIYDELPVTTRGLMVISDTLRQHWVLVAGGLAGIVLGLRQWLASAAGREKVDHWKLGMPGLRGLFSQIYLVQSLQVLSLSLQNGVSVMDSLNACRDVVHNSEFRKLITAIEEHVQSGQGVSAGLEGAKFVPDLAKHMIQTGEQTGNLGKVMGRVAEYYEAQLSKKLDAVSKLAEPIMLLVMGVIVGVLVSSLILPIFKLSRAVS